MVPLGCIADARQTAAGVSIEDFLAERCEPKVLASIDSLVNVARERGRYHFGAVLVQDIADRLPVIGDPWMKIRDYCRLRLNDDVINPGFLVEVIILVFRPAGVGAWLDTNMVRQSEPTLLYDDDHLLEGPQDEITFTKEGVLTQSHYLLYAPQVQGAVLSGGFVDELLTVRNRTRVLSKFGLAIDREALLERSYHSDCVTKAFIRGPRGISSTILNNSGFPQDPKGTVTVHQRVHPDPLHKLYPLERLEVMWSFRGGIKSVQIEELLPLEQRGCLQSRISNRYVHSRWDPTVSAFVHLDGAIRIYDAQNYTDRLVTDLKKHPGKNAQYMKAFRLDGEISLPDWCNLVSKFFENNELVLEYLGGPENLS